MAGWAAKKYALRMTLRVNPTMFIHQLLARRDCLHLDAFAYYWPERHPDSVLFALEHRAGGRGDIILPNLYWLATIEDYSKPMEVDGRQARYYDTMDTVRFNTRSFPAEHHHWARRVHHKYMLGGYKAPPPRGFKHVSLVCHYWHPYDMPPFPNDIANHYHRRYGVKPAIEFQ